MSCIATNVNANEQFTFMPPSPPSLTESTPPTNASAGTSPEDKSFSEVRVVQVEGSPYVSLYLVVRQELTQEEAALWAEQFADALDSRQFASMSRSKRYQPYHNWKCTFGEAIARLLNATPRTLVDLHHALLHPPQVSPQSVNPQAIPTTPKDL